MKINELRDKLNEMMANKDDAPLANLGCALISCGKEVKRPFEILHEYCAGNPNAKMLIRTD